MGYTLNKKRKSRTDLGGRGPLFEVYGLADHFRVTKQRRECLEIVDNE